MIERMSSLPPRSCGCALPANTSWTGRFGSESSFLTRSSVGEKERRALVRRESPGEADRQRVRVEHLVGELELLARRATSLGGRTQPPARVLDEAMPAVLVHLPQLGIGDLGGARPELLVVALLCPARA